MSAIDNEFGHDPKPGFRWPVSVTHHIAAPAEDVWAAISMPGNLGLCHPFCEKNPVRSWPGVGSRDLIYYLSGLVLEREFCRWIEGVGYDLEIGPPGQTRSTFVSWRIRPATDAHCVLTISIYPHHLQHIPVVIRWLPHHLHMRPLLKKYLLSVVKGFAWYVTRGEAVPRNQFGVIPYFSNRQSVTRPG